MEEQRDVAVLLTQLDIVEQRMADNQLIAPAGDSARDIVLALRAEYAGDERLQVMTNRLGEQLLTDAVLSTTAGEFVTAREQLNGVESLGILQTEIDAARNALEDAMASAEPEVRPLAEAATPNDSSPDLEATEATRP